MRSSGQFALLKPRLISFPNDPYHPDAAYELIEKTEEDEFVETYLARQVNVNRRVTVLKLLKEQWVKSRSSKTCLFDVIFLPTFWPSEKLEETRRK
ncbi:hypothetical protein WDW89_18215 [Deltaproteobacteria bacterium TL4]